VWEPTAIIAAIAGMQSACVVVDAFMSVMSDSSAKQYIT
jgi:hypothetical protein